LDFTNLINFDSRLKLTVSHLLFGISWLLPVNVRPWTTFYPEFFAFLYLFFLAIKLGTDPIRLTLPIFFVIFFSFIPLTQLISGLTIFAGDAQLHTIYLAAFSLAVIVGFNIAQDKSDGREFFYFFTITLVIVSVISSFIAFRQWLGLANTGLELNHQGARAYANLGQPNHLSSLLCLGGLSLIYLYEKKVVNKVAASFMVFAIIFALAITQSRTPLVTGLAIVVLWFWQSRKFGYRLSPIWVSIWFSVFLVFFAAFPTLSEILTLPAQSHGERASAGKRLDLWMAALAAIDSQRLIGYGWGQIILAQINVSQELSLGGLMFYSHNLFLDILLWNGICLGSLIILGMSVWSVLAALASSRLEATFALLVAVTILTHAMFEYPHAYAYFLLTVGLMLGVLENERSHGRAFRVPNWLRRLLALTVVCFLIVSIREYRHYSVNDFNRRISSAGVIGFEQQELGGKFRLFTQLEKQQKFKDIALNDEILSSDLEAMRRIALRYPYLSNVYRYSLALFLNGRPDDGYIQIDLINSIHGKENCKLAVEQINKALIDSGKEMIIMDRHRTPLQKIVQ
jgi:O-antigen ligase